MDSLIIVNAPLEKEIQISIRAANEDITFVVAKTQRTKLTRISLRIVSLSASYSWA